ncbi:hypothetical protein J8273_7809 [Carpediemonas membranifera]|uniref:Uncharacterized protein n=1 Tax=Carpediemonas membranifera TaxID=201153 RepID=A0A8J6DZA8_9EUKA|nr:hypothetical protein J8273_7809 [Carpediemonas membranifera]|eukprot:KAG9390458.1 hypothetical protein J8273_7809 [Carpediemonas membranifera]
MVDGVLWTQIQCRSANQMPLKRTDKELRQTQWETLLERPIRTICIRARAQGKLERSRRMMPQLAPTASRLASVVASNA